MILLRDHEMQSLQQTQQLRVAGISQLLSAESERLIFLRNYTEHLLAIQKGPYAVPSDGHLQAAYAHRDEPVWELPVPEGDAVLYGVGPAQLQGLQGFERRDGDLVAGLYVARALGYLISTDPPTAPAIERKLTYISSNGFFVAHPPVSRQDVPAIMQRIARSAYFRNNLPQANPSREMRWSLLPAEDGRDDMYLTLSVPLYLDEQFRGVAVVEISQDSLDNYLIASTHTGVRSFLMDAEGNLLASGGSGGSVKPGAQFSSVVPPAWRDTTARQLLSRGAGTLRSPDGSRLLFQRVGDTKLLLVDYFSASDLLEVFMSQMSVLFGASIVSLALLLWATLKAVSELFAHYLERGEALRELAETDPLTGLANRRVFESRFAIERNHRRRDDSALSVLMIDIDRFKQINDQWGHASGDRVLKTVASVLRETLRTIDVPARIGGEEFAVLLPKTGIAEARQVAERLREVLAQTPCEPASETSPASPAPRISFTVSIGAAEARMESCDELDALLMAADRRLYAAKANGRNRVVSDDSVVDDPRQLTQTTP
ncbi:diguanylate cyclase [Cupriavidus sp. IDO]|uniref:diguanylate cyclase n=1 Tax=Cupriavidus sp. IDO TaxID=1539142 RepID=UPI002377EDD1|nr:diguanylate cyclase [Cupriavidus sp. IDO]